MPKHLYSLVHLTNINCPPPQFIYTAAKAGYDAVSLRTIPLELLAELLLKRSLGIGILWLLGMSLFAVPGFCLAAVYAGFSMAFLISSMTVQAGLMGVFLFLLSVFPQMIFYLPVLAGLYIWAMAPGNKIHGGGFAVLLILTAAGAASELAGSEGRDGADADLLEVQGAPDLYCRGMADGVYLPFHCRRIYGRAKSV